MNIRNWIAATAILFFASFPTHANERILNLYVWAGEIPDFIVRRFEKETGINVNFSTFESNEIMYAKIRASKKAGYDLIMPSSYFVDRMTRQNLLEKLDKAKLANWHNVHPDFQHPAYDPHLDYSLPVVWGITGIFVNQKYYAVKSISKWANLWEQRFYDQLLLLDDTREVFSMALLTLGYSANDQNPEHIKQAYLKLKSLMPNVKIFSSGTAISIMTDEDARVGMAWNGDAFKAARENQKLRFIFPKEGFVVWVDNLCLLKTSRHKDEAYAFLDYILRPDIAKDIALATSFPTPNQAALKLLPPALSHDETVYPPESIMKHAQFQTDISDETLALYTQYWEELKMSG